MNTRFNPLLPYACVVGFRKAKSRHHLQVVETTHCFTERNVSEMPCLDTDVGSDDKDIVLLHVCVRMCVCSLQRKKQVCVPPPRLCSEYRKTQQHSDTIKEMNSNKRAMLVSSLICDFKNTPNILTGWSPWFTSHQKSTSQWERFYSHSHNLTLILIQVIVAVSSQNIFIPAKKTAVCSFEVNLLRFILVTRLQALIVLKIPNIIFTLCLKQFLRLSLWVPIHKIIAVIGQGFWSSASALSLPSQRHWSREFFGCVNYTEFSGISKWSLPNFSEC